MRYFKNNEHSSIFFDGETQLHIVGKQPSFLKFYNPGLHKKVAEGLRHGAIIEIVKDEYDSLISGKPLLPVAEAEVAEAEVAEAETQPSTWPSMDEFVTKEELITWVESQTWLTEDQLNEVYKIKKLAPLKEVIQTLIDTQK